MSYDYESTVQLFLQPKLGKDELLVDVQLIKGISWRLQAFKANNDSGLFVDVNVGAEVDKQNLSFAVRIDVKPKVFSRISKFFPLDRSYIENDLSEGFQLNGAGKYNFQSVLEANKFVLQLKATLTIRSSRDLVAPTLALTEFFKDISNRDLADFTIQIGSDTWKAHKFILSARSPVFRRMLANKECEESKQSHLKIVDVTKDTFEIFFQFLYTSRVPNLLLKQATDVLIVAHKYDVQDLKKLCDNSLIQLLRETDPVHDIFQFTHAYNCSQELKMKAFGFVKSSIFKNPNMGDGLVEMPQLVETLVEVVPIIIEVVVEMMQEMMAKMNEQNEKIHEYLMKMNETGNVAKKRKIQE